MGKKKRGYFVREKDAEYGFPIVATSGREAKKLAWQRCELDCDWVDIEVHWNREADVEDLPIGYVEDEILGLRRGLFSYFEDGECELCGNSGRVECHEGKIICDDCLSKTTKKG